MSDTSPGVGGGASYTYHDDTVSGGTTYYYTVKSNDGVACTSPASTEVSTRATGICTLAAHLRRADLRHQPSGRDLHAEPLVVCGDAGVRWPSTYNVYRSTSTGFTPGPANRIAQNLSATSYSDLDNLVSGTTYYYVVRAVDSSNAWRRRTRGRRAENPPGPSRMGRGPPVRRAATLP